MNSSIKNLRAVEDAAAKGGFGDNQEARFATRDLEAEDTGVSLHLIKPGKRQAFAHKHDEAEEVYVVLSGTGRVKLDDEVHEIGPLDAIRVAPSVVRAFEAGPEPLEFLACGAHHDKDGEIIREDVWGD